VPVPDIVATLETLKLPDGRFEIVAEHPWVVVDYAHTPDALTRTLAAARRLTGARVILVFGAGGQRDTRKRGPMGRAASRADVVYVTNDNPRGEDPMAIARDLVDGIGPHPAVHIELDRAWAIASAVREAGPEDVVLVCGRGHETHQTIGDQRVPLSDAAVARAAWAER
jgi:UDP-N-acetylmuramoyl-L-alanyl-D-glutamate--2,6-diaminopimelate ligase